MHQTTSPEDRGACACTTLRKASRAVTRMYDDALAGTGMSVVQLSILGHIERGGDVPLMTLADLLVMERTTVYRALAPLETRGWVRIADGRGRAKTVHLTDAGRRARTDALAAWAGAQAAVVGALGDDWPALEATLGRVVAIAETARAG